MEKADYERILQSIVNARYQLDVCYDDSEINQEYETNIRQAGEYLRKAELSLEELLNTRMGVVVPGEPEYQFRFHPEKGRYAFVALRVPGAHPDTKARIFRREGERISGATEAAVVKAFDLRKNPPGGPAVLEYHSGFDGLFYRIKPNFEDGTAEFLQETPEVAWR